MVSQHDLYLPEPLVHLRLVGGQQREQPDRAIWCIRNDSEKRFRETPQRNAACFRRWWCRERRQWHERFSTWLGRLQLPEGRKEKRRLSLQRQWNHTRQRPWEHKAKAVGA